MANVHVKCKLVANQVENLIVARVLHQIRSRSYVGRVRALGDEFQCKGSTAGRNTIGRGIVSTLDDTVGRAFAVTRADSRVPLIAIVTVCIVSFDLSSGSVSKIGEGVARMTDVEPTPIGVNNDFPIVGFAIGASSARACLPCHLRMRLGLIGTGPLSGD